MNFQTEVDLNPIITNQVFDNLENQNVSNFENMGNFKDQMFDHHRKVRIRQIDRIKAQKRKQLQVNQIIEQFLTRNFPKQHDSARRWATQVVSLCENSNNYDMDAHKLRDIFLLAQKFPHISTFRLLHYGISISGSAVVATLYDVDIFKLLHNALKDPEIYCKLKKINEGSNSGQIESEEDQKFQFMKISISIICQLYRKHFKWRNFSIQNHSTFSNYVLKMYKKHKYSMKTQTIDFIKHVFYHRISDFHQQYLKIFDLISNLVCGYRAIFDIFLAYKDWRDDQIKESMQDGVLRAGSAIEVITNVFLNHSYLWLDEWIKAKMSNHQYDYLHIVETYLNMAQFLIIKLTKNKEILQENHQFFLKVINIFYYSTLFFSASCDKITVNKSHQLIPKIFEKLCWFLYFIKKCEYERFSLSNSYQGLTIIENAKKVAIFYISETISSEAGLYDDLIKNIIFFKIIDNNSITEVNILELIISYLKTEYSSKILKELLILSIGIMSLNIYEKDLGMFSLISQIFERFCELLIDQLKEQEIKEGISRELEVYFESSTNQFSRICLEIFMGSYYEKILVFMNSKFCGQQLQKCLDKLITIAKQSSHKINDKEHQI